MGASQFIFLWMVSSAAAANILLFDGSQARCFIINNASCNFQRLHYGHTVLVYGWAISVKECGYSLDELAFTPPHPFSGMLSYLDPCTIVRLGFKIINMSCPRDAVGFKRVLYLEGRSSCEPKNFGGDTWRSISHVPLAVMRMPKG